MLRRSLADFACRSSPARTERTFPKRSTLPWYFRIILEFSIQTTRTLWECAADFLDVSSEKSGIAGKSGCRGPFAHPSGALSIHPWKMIICILNRPVILQFEVIAPAGSTLFFGETLMHATGQTYTKTDAFKTKNDGFHAKNNGFRRSDPQRTGESDHCDGIRTDNVPLLGRSRYGL